ncbi:MAG: superfamily I DNA and RNA helicase [Candidatus Endobugula sp.]|jgi:superfamily I DNA and RNA helicase
MSALSQKQTLISIITAECLPSQMSFAIGQKRTLSIINSALCEKLEIQRKFYDRNSSVFFKLVGLEISSVYKLKSSVTHSNHSLKWNAVVIFNSLDKLSTANVIYQNPLKPN